MKKLLGSISALVLGGTALGSMPIMTQNQIHQRNMVESAQYYWNEDHTEALSEFIVERNSDPSVPRSQIQKTIYTINLGVKKPKFSNLSFINSTGFKAAWFYENWSWEVPNLTVQFEDENYFQFDNENIDNSKFNNFLTKTIFDQDAKANSVEKAHFTTKTGNTWYNEDDVYYMQFLLYQYVSIGPSLAPTATNYVSLGDKLELS